jgi:hypothetical protein
MTPNRSFTEQFFEKKELFAYIRGRGLKIDDSLLQEFQEQGLMIAPRRRGRGRGRGNPGLWSLQQCNLLCSLCHLQQKRGVRHIAQRCNLPVWVWLYWGDEYGITRDQVKHVMKTWAERQQHHSLKTVRQSARQLVNEVANHRNGGKQVAINEIAEILYAGAAMRQNLEESLSHVFDGTKPANGPHGIPIAPEGVGWYIELRMKAIHALLHNDAIPDIHWEWAQCFHLTHVSQYVMEQGQYARETAGTPVESVFSLETIESLWSSACADLAAIIGLGLHWPATPGMPEQLRLDIWMNRVKSATVTSKLRVSPVMLPNGKFPLSLEIMETVTLQ